MSFLTSQRRSRVNVNLRKVLLMINVSFLNEIQQNFKYTFLDVFFSKESENDDKIWKKLEKPSFFTVFLQKGTLKSFLLIF